MTRQWTVEDELERLRAENASLELESATRLKALKSIEFIDGVCPACHSTRLQGHTFVCQIFLAMGEIKIL